MQRYAAAGMQLFKKGMRNVSLLNKRLSYFQEFALIL